MGAIPKVARGNDQTYEAVDANLAAGVLVIPSTTATHSGLQGVKVAGDAAVNVLGASARSAVTYANQAAAQVSTDDGYPLLDVSVPDCTLTVYRDCIVPLTFTAVAVAFGVKLCAAASGQVRAWVDGTDSAASIVGESACVMSGSGGVGNVRLY